MMPLFCIERPLNNHVRNRHWCLATHVLVGQRAGDGVDVHLLPDPVEGDGVRAVLGMARFRRLGYPDSRHDGIRHDTLPDRPDIIHAATDQTQVYA
jgi:hypothetical protein